MPRRAGSLLRLVADRLSDEPPGQPAQDAARPAALLAGEEPGDGGPERPAARRVEGTLPGWARRLLAWSVTVLVTGAVLWAVVQVLARVWPVVIALLAALLLTALVSPVHERVGRVGAPPALSALLSVLFLLGIPAGVGLLLYQRTTAQLGNLTQALRTGLDDLRSRLVAPPLSLDASQVDQLRDAAVRYLDAAVPSPQRGAQLALTLLAGAALAVFAVFFLLKDGRRMWDWVVEWSPAARRPVVRVGGEVAWTTLRRYVTGTVLVALADSAAIGVVLVVVGVPLWLSLTLLTFLGAFVPVIGATVAGAAAVLVTLVTEGGRDALVVAAAVLLVQQLEGNLLQPLLMGRVIDLHPLVILVAVSCGVLLLGIMGALIAVPLVAVVHRVVRRLRELEDADGERLAGGPAP